MNYEKTRLDRNRITRRMKLAHYEGRGLHMETGFNFLFIKICGLNRAAGAATSDLDDETLKYNKFFDQSIKMEVTEPILTGL